MRLAAVIGWFSRCMVSWRPSDAMGAQEAAACAEQASREYGTSSAMGSGQGHVRPGGVRLAACARRDVPEHGRQDGMEGQRADGALARDPRERMPEAGGMQHAAGAQGHHRGARRALQQQADPPVPRLRHAGGMAHGRHGRGCIGLQWCRCGSQGFGRNRASVSHCFSQFTERGKDGLHEFDLMSWR